MRANLLWPIAVIVALVVGYLWRGDPPAAADAPRARTGRVLAPRIKALEARVASLEAEAARREAADAPDGADEIAPADARRAPARPRPVEVAADAPPEATGVAQALAKGDPAVRNQLRRLIAQEREAEREARHERFRERAAERTRQMVDDLADQTGLDADQRGLVQERLDEERKLVMGLFRAAREDGTFHEARREAEAARDATDAQVKAELSDAQYARYLELRDENSWGPPRRRRPDRSSK